jgi:hypothetical protein
MLRRITNFRNGDHGFIECASGLGNAGHAPTAFFSHADTVDSPDGEGDQTQLRQPKAAQNAAA